MICAILTAMKITIDEGGYIMRRKLYDGLKQWKKQSRGRSAILIQGARRVGKSYIAEQFAQAEYKSYILIDFNKVNQQIRDLFLYDIDDLNLFFSSFQPFLL